VAEFTLPDEICELLIAEGRLKEELSRRQADYQLVCQNYPGRLDPKKTPAFYLLLVAHRKWQHAYEKLTLLRYNAAQA